jgi:hypothetical protein
MQPYEKPDVAAYSALLASSFLQLTKRELIAPGDDLPERLYFVPFAVVSHGTQDDPIFRYGNKAALDLFKMTWEEFTHMPSRLSAEAMLQEERERLLAEARAKGFVDTYEGVRIAKDGQRFMIRDTVLWNVIDSKGVRHGQACVILTWDFIPKASR